MGIPFSFYLGNTFMGTIDFNMILLIFLTLPPYGWVFKNWGWTLQASVEHLWQGAPIETRSVHPLGTHTPTTVHTVSHLVDPSVL